MTSMHRRAFAPLGRPRHAVTLGAQLLKQVHDCLFARIFKDPAGQVLGADQQLFRFGHETHLALCS